MRSKNPETMNNIIRFVEKHYRVNGSSPTTRQIAKGIGISNSTVHNYLLDMSEKGMIEYDGTTIITEVTRKYSERFAGAAILDNAISCGKPEYQEEHIEEYVQLPVSLFGTGDFYILKASGDSMIKAGIDTGDAVVIKKQNTANFGDIVVALADGQNTLKTYAYDAELKRVVLHPENDEYDDIYPEEIYIQGVAVNVIKKLK